MSTNALLEKMTGRWVMVYKHNEQELIKALKLNISAEDAAKYGEVRRGSS